MSGAEVKDVSEKLTPCSCASNCSVAVGMKTEGFCRAAPWVITTGVRLAYTEGSLGLHFRINGELDSYPNDNVLGHRDMAYINGLIEADERRRESGDGK